MKLVKQGDINAYPLVRNRNKKLIDMLDKMEKGDILEISDKDFTGRYPYPHPVLSSFKNRTKKTFSIRTLEGKKKWIIIRT